MRKIFALLIAAVMLFAVGCGGSPEVDYYDSNNEAYNPMDYNPIDSFIDTFEITDIFGGSTVEGLYAEAAMLNAAGDMVIHIYEDMLIYFEDGTPLRDALPYGQTVAEFLEGRRLEVTYNFVLLSFPGQVYPLSITILDY